MPNEGSGGDHGGDDDYDQQLAHCFKEALKLTRLRSQSTATGFGLSTYAQQISDRFNEARHCLLLSPELQPIAKKLMELGPSDRINPSVIDGKFTGFDL